MQGSNFQTPMKSFKFNKGYNHLDHYAMYLSCCSSIYAFDCSAYGGIYFCSYIISFFLVEGHRSVSM